MNIALIVSSLSNRGPVLVVQELVSELIKNDHYCEVFYIDDKNELYFSCITRKINRSSDFSRFDIIHSHGLRPDLYALKLKKGGKYKAKFVTTLHNYVFDDLKSQFNAIVSFFVGKYWMYKIKSFDNIIVLSDNAKEYYDKILNCKNITRIYNTRKVDINQTLSESEVYEIEEFKNGYSLLGVNALLSPIKGIDIIIKNLVSLPNFKLFIVGDGKSKKSLENLAIKLKVQNRCYFAGYRENAHRYLRYYDIYVLSSRSEGFPLALLESAAYGKPTVVSDLPVVKECFTENEVSFFQLETPSSIVQAIINASTSEELGINFNVKFCNTYSPNVFYLNHIGLYSNLHEVL